MTPRTGSPAGSRARDALPQPGRDRSHPDLARLGGVVRGLRLEHGFGTRTLAVRSAAARSTIQRLERGDLRPRPSLLHAVAWALDPDRSGELAGVLFVAAGGCVAAEGRWWRYRARRLDLGMSSGAVPLPRELGRRVAAHQQAAAARAAAYGLLDGAAWADDAGRMAEASRLLADAAQLDREAGNVIRIGSVTYGL